MVAIDLPGAGERMHERATLASWRGALREVVDDGDVLVGHSQGGFGISLAADEVPDKIARLVYLSAAVPIQGKSQIEAAPQANDWPETIGMAEEEYRAIIELPEQGPCVAITNPEAANKVFYHDCTPEDQAWAFERLTPLVVAPDARALRHSPVLGSTDPARLHHVQRRLLAPGLVRQRVHASARPEHVLQHPLVALPVRESSRGDGTAARSLCPRHAVVGAELARASVVKARGSRRPRS